MILNFITSYEDPKTGNLVTDIKLISKRYCKTWFLLDIVAIFPFELVAHGTGSD